MGKLYMKEKKISLVGKYKVFDEQDRVKFTVEGSFIKIPKRFKVENSQGKEVAEVAKKLISLRPKYTIYINGKEVVTLKKRLAAIGSKYKINSEDIEVKGDWWNYNFKVLRKGKQIAKVSKKLLSWGDSFVMEVNDDRDETLIVALVVAIDRMMDDEDDEIVQD